MLPVSALGYLVRDHIFNQTRLDLHQQQRLWVKSIGMGIFDRLARIHRDLVRLSAMYSAEHRDPVQPLDMDPLKVDRHQFQSVFLVYNTDRILMLHGEPPQAFSLTGAQQRHLDTGQPLLKLTGDTGVSRRVFMAVSLNLEISHPPSKQFNPINSTPSLLVAELNLAALVDFEFYLPAQADYCVLTSDYVPLGCSDNQIDSRALTDAMMTHPNSAEPVEYRNGQRTYFGYQWSIFLEGAYATANWHTVLVRSREVLFSSLEALPRLFLLVSSAAVLLALLLGSAQLRKQLRPLTLLREGTQALARGDFETRVVTGSRDEFEELSESFNKMAHQIHMMFKTNGILSELDRIILTTPDARYIIQTVMTLADAGITIAIDDFGTGYSSLSYLARFPIHYLKIDRSFITDIPEQSNVATVVSSIIALAHALDLRIVAEGIDDEAQLPLLNQCGCEILQGFLFSKTLPPDDFYDYVKSQHPDQSIAS